MSTVTILALPLSSPASACSSGAMVLHGPHHSAPNSTSTGSSLSKTSCSKFRSVTVGRGIGRVSEGSETPLMAPVLSGVKVELIARTLRLARSPSSAFGEAFARTEAERTLVREHRTAAKTKPKVEIGGRGQPPKIKVMRSSYFALGGRKSACRATVRKATEPAASNAGTGLGLGSPSKTPHVAVASVFGGRRPACETAASRAVSQATLKEALTNSGPNAAAIRPRKKATSGVRPKPCGTASG